MCHTQAIFFVFDPLLAHREEGKTSEKDRFRLKKSTLLVVFDDLRKKFSISLQIFFLKSARQPTKYYFWRSRFNKSKSKNVFFCIDSSCFFSILFFNTSFQSFPMISILFSSSFFETFAFNFQFFFPVFGSGVNQKSP